MQKEYKKFFINTMLLLGIMFLLTLVTFFAVGRFVIGNQFICYPDSQVVHFWDETQNEANEKIGNKRKMVILSSSNSLFSIDYKKMNEELDLPVLNYASHGGLVSYIFYRAKRVLHEGDVVIMPLEYTLYNDYYEIEPQSLTLTHYIIGYDSDYYRNGMSLTSKFKLLNFLFVQAFYDRMRSGKIELDRNEAPYFMDKDLNMSENVKLEKKVLLQHLNGVERIVISKDYQKWDLYKFIMWCKENNIKVFACPPAKYNNGYTKVDIDMVQATLEDFYANLDVEFFGNVKDCLYDEKYIYDTDYHLNIQGREIRTKKLIEEIKQLKY